MHCFVARHEKTLFALGRQNTVSAFGTCVWYWQNVKVLFGNRNWKVVACVWIGAVSAVVLFVCISLLSASYKSWKVMDVIKSHGESWWQESRVMLATWLGARLFLFCLQMFEESVSVLVCQSSKLSY